MSRDFADDKQQQQHQQQQQQAALEARKCKNCGKVFADRHQFQGHNCVFELHPQYNYERVSAPNNDAHTENQDKPYKCGVCQHSFATSVTLSTHMRMHGVEKLLECQNCGKTFGHVAALNRHKKTPGECTK